MSYDSTSRIARPRQSPYAGTTVEPPGAGVRTEATESGRISQTTEGGLLAIGTDVEITAPQLTGSGRSVFYRGRVIDAGSVPAPFVAVLAESMTGRDRPVVVFTGPGVTIEPNPAPQSHPGLR